MAPNKKVEDYFPQLAGTDFGGLYINELIYSYTNAGFVICPHCGATFANIVWDEPRDYVKCLLCNWEIGPIGYGPQGNPSNPLVALNKWLLANVQRVPKSKHN